MNQKNTLKLSLHQKIMLTWILSAPWAFSPLMAEAKRVNAGEVMAWGVIIVAVMILAAPKLLNSTILRRWYGWTDALSQRQLQALAQRNLSLYYRTALDDGYMSRLIPYLKRITWSVVSLLLVTALLPCDSGSPFLDALVAFSLWYPFGVMILILTSCPYASKKRGR